MNLKNIFSSIAKPTQIYDGLQKANWVVTILFFIMALGVSLYVWWDVVYRQEPRAKVVTTYEQNKNDFEGMSRKVSGAISKLENRKERYENAKDYQEQRELFKVEKPESLDVAPSTNTRQNLLSPKEKPKEKVIQ